MEKTEANPKVDFFFKKADKWQEEVVLLREIISSSGLTEELKWGCPCYTLNGSNVVLIHTFKEYCALLFFKGSLMKDSKHVLVQQTKNVQVSRQLRFKHLEEIAEQKTIIKAYIKEAIEIEKSGVKVELKKTTEFEMPKEFENKLSKAPKLKKAFEELTPGRQRAYLLHFAAPKQSKTRVARIEKAIPTILDGKGLND